MVKLGVAPAALPKLLTGAVMNSLPGPVRESAEVRHNRTFPEER